MGHLPPRRAIGRQLTPPRPTTCPWCESGDLPDPVLGLCESCCRKMHTQLTSRKWRIVYRQYFFSLPENYYCQLFCKMRKLITPANEIDHIEPWRKRPDLFWEESNHQGACKSCHSQKTYQEDGSFGNPKQ